MDLFVYFLFGLNFGFSASISHNSNHGKEITEESFNQFIQTYKKPYIWGSREYYKRFEIYKSNCKQQDELNRQRSHNVSAFYGETKFSDWTSQEFKDYYLSSLRRPVSSQNLNTVNLIQEKGFRLQDFTQSAYPPKWDWRDKNIVTSVKNQKSCGACWAFSAVEVIEGMNALKTGQLKSLSVQQVIDCSVGYNHILGGCKGGDTCNALSWLMDKDVSLVDEASYPLQDTQQACKVFLNKTQGVHVKHYACFIGPKSFVNREKQLLSILANYGPVAVSVDATRWSNYLGGIVQYHCGELPNNHAVEIVGYDTTGPVPYYIVKNSWGADFGLNGYIYIKIGGNVCAISNKNSKFRNSFLNYLFNDTKPLYIGIAEEVATASVA